MVAGGNSKSSDAPSQAAPNLPFSVQSLPASLQLPVYRVDDGRSATYVAWETALKALCFHMRVPYDTLGMGPPTSESLLPLTRSKNEDLVQQAVRLAEWQQLNTQLFLHIRNSIDLSGPLQSIRQREVDAFTQGALADGDGFVAYVRSFADLSSVESQALLQLKVIQSRLPPDASRNQLLAHCVRLLERWTSILGNDRNKPLAYYKQLLTSLPAAPLTSPMVLVRHWFAERIFSTTIDDGCRIFAHA